MHALMIIDGRDGGWGCLECCRELSFFSLCISGHLPLSFLILLSSYMYSLAYIVDSGGIFKVEGQYMDKPT